MIWWTPTIGTGPTRRSTPAARISGFTSIERIVVHGQQEGAFRSDLDARLLSWIFYGAIEEILTGWVLGQLPDSDDDVAEAEQTVVAALCEGLIAS